MIEQCTTNAMLAHVRCNWCWAAFMQAILTRVYSNFYIAALRPFPHNFKIAVASFARNIYIHATPSGQSAPRCALDGTLGTTSYNARARRPKTNPLYALLGGSHTPDRAIVYQVQSRVNNIAFFGLLFLVAFYMRLCYSFQLLLLG